MKVSDLKKYLEQFDNNQEIDFVVNTSSEVEDSDNDIRPNVELQGVGSDIPTIFLYDKFCKKFWKIVDQHLDDEHVIITDKSIEWTDIDKEVTNFYNLEDEEQEEYESLLDYLSTKLKGFEYVSWDEVYV